MEWKNLVGLRRGCSNILVQGVSAEKNRVGSGDKSLLEF